MAEFNKVKNYMTKDVITVTEDTTPVEIQNMIKKTGHDGFPVQNNENKIVGIVTASDLITKDFTPTIRDMMSTDIVVANEELTINDAARVMFRMGISRLPVTNEEEGVIGIITNTDILRSHIERSTPTKVNQFRTSLEQLYNIKTTLHEENVPIKLMKPTQDKIYADELQGRTYEIERGLAEPVILVKTKDKYVVVDGHHRIVAAYQKGYDKIGAYVIQLSKDIKLGLEKTAEKNNIFSLDDIEIIEDAQHPLIAITDSIKNQNKEKNKKKGI